MAPNELAELQQCFNAASRKLVGRQLVDTEPRLQQLYLHLASGKVSPDIQTKLLIVARAVATDMVVEANREFAKLCTDHWETQKDWLVGVKRLLSAQ